MPPPPSQPSRRRPRRSPRRRRRRQPPQQTAPKPAIQEVKPVQQEAVRKEEPAKPAEAKAKASVSGIPLDPNAKRGGVLVISGPTSEGPTFSTWEEAAGVAFYAVHPVNNMLVQNQTWGTLDDFKNLAFFKVQPDLAKSWEQSTDGSKWTFKLRDGVKWSDGKAFTCADVKWSYDSIRTGTGLKRSPRAVHWLAVKEITCPDDLTLVITLKRPKPAFLEVVGQPYNVVRPKHIYEANTDPLRTAPPAVGTGPFLVKERLPGEKIVFTRNPGYWDQPLPYLDGIELRILANPAIDAGMLAGRLDIPTSSGYTGPRAERMLKECQVCQFWPRVVASSTSPKLFLNQQRPPWNDPAIEEAVALAIDNEKYNKVVQLGWYVAPTGGGFYPGGPWEMPAERLKQIPGYGDFLPGGNPEADKARARELLKQAGYKPNELKVTVNFWAIIQQDIPAIIEDLKAIGIDASSRVMADAENYNTLTEGAFDIHVHSLWVAGLDPDVLLYEHYYTGSDRNYNRYSNPNFDALVDGMSQTTDPEQRKRLAWDALEIALRESGQVTVGHSTQMPTAHKRVRGFLPALNYLAGYGPLLRWQNVWLEP